MISRVMKNKDKAYDALSKAWLALGVGALVAGIAMALIMDLQTDASGAHFNRDHLVNETPVGQVFAVLTSIAAIQYYHTRKDEQSQTDSACKERLKKVYLLLAIALLVCTVLCYTLPRYQDLTLTMPAEWWVLLGGYMVILTHRFF
jgi:uncharacterized membrane protein YidH (DUF202 family)